MNFEEFKENINQLDCKSKDNLKNIVENIVENIDITPENFNLWIDYVYSERILDIDFYNLPYAIDELYKTNDKLKFMLCCMLIESTCTKLPFITNLENYPLFRAKYEILKNTLVSVFNAVDNGIANCMALIMLNCDPKFTLLNDDELNRLILATNRKLSDIIKYLQTTHNINNSVYSELELLIDLATYMKNNEIYNKIEKLSTLPLNFSCKLFIAKYKLINNINISNDEINRLLSEKNQLYRIVSIFEQSGNINKLPLDEINQSEIAMSSMINWLVYPTELGKEPDEIELLGELDYNNYIYYIFKFKSNDFRIKDYMLGISGGYEKNKITSNSTGATFSNFEAVESDFMEQAKRIVNFITNYQNEKK